MKSFKEKTVKKLNRYNHTFIEDTDIIEKTINATLSEVEEQLNIAIHNFKLSGGFLNSGEVIETIKQIIKEMKK